jgi:hypothetical protein
VIKVLTTGITIAGLFWGALHVVGTQADVLVGGSEAKGDRLGSRPVEDLCGDWPYYHHACAHDLTNNDRPRRKRHIVSRTIHRKTFLDFL